MGLAHEADRVGPACRGAAPPRGECVDLSRARRRAQSCPFARRDRLAGAGLSEGQRALERDACHPSEAGEPGERRVGRTAGRVLRAVLRVTTRPPRRPTRSVSPSGRNSGTSRLIARSLTQLGEAALLQCDLGEARRLYEQSLAALARDRTPKRAARQPAAASGNLARLEGEAEEATSLLEESLAVCLEIGSRGGEASALHSLGVPSRRLEASRTRLHASTARRWRAGRTWRTSAVWRQILWRLGALAALRAAFESAARLLGASDASQGARRSDVPPCDRREYERAVAESKAGTRTDGRSRRPGRPDADSSSRTLLDSASAATHSSARGRLSRAG